MAALHGYRLVLPCAHRFLRTYSLDTTAAVKFPQRDARFVAQSALLLHAGSASSPQCPALTATPAAIAEPMPGSRLKSIEPWLH
jgi:hypothetical protein